MQAYALARLPPCSTFAALSLSLPPVLLLIAKSVRHVWRRPQPARLRTHVASARTHMGTATQNSAVENKTWSVCLPLAAPLTKPRERRGTPQKLSPAETVACVASGGSADRFAGTGVSSCRS
uniref:Putative secreted protein n=1 Tax=Amblyomma triste TaxID=251400 RepID=A0A023G0Q3_AMBTT